jgi:hypothetical protein
METEEIVRLDGTPLKGHSQQREDFLDPNYRRLLAAIVINAIEVTRDTNSPEAAEAKAWLDDLGILIVELLDCGREQAVKNWLARQPEPAQMSLFEVSSD